MAITSSAKRALRVSARQRVFNLRRARVMRDTLKEVRSLAGKGEVKKAQEILPQAYQAIDKATKRGVIKANTASRTKSRLSKFLKTKSAK